MSHSEKLVDALAILVIAAGLATALVVRAGNKEPRAAPFEAHAVTQIMPGSADAVVGP